MWRFYTKRPQKDEDERNLTEREEEEGNAGMEVQYMLYKMRGH